MSNALMKLKTAWWSLIRFGFRLLYNEMAFTYDTVSWIAGLGRWHGWQRTALPHLNIEPGARVLELAHGTGHLEIDLRRAGYQPAALDLSRAMGRIAQTRLRRWGWRPSLVRARAQAIPFGAETFAAVVSTFPTEFIIDPATLAEVYRVLRPGGRLVVVFGGLLTAKNAAAGALEVAYRATGQRGPWPAGVEGRLKTAGFSAQIIAEDLPGSTALLFVAEKTSLVR
jgi:SAM-dependent methyltransferase